MQSLMLDLETLSTHANAHILSIGACKFDENGISHEFYANITPAEQTGAHIDPLTVQWWLKQDVNAKLELTKDQEFLEEVLKRFAFWATAEGKCLVWGNGSDFDNVILANAYARYNLQLPWEFYNNRCYRTVKNLFPVCNKVAPHIKHHALSDAISQANHLIEIRSYLNSAFAIDLFNPQVTYNETARALGHSPY